MSNVIEVKTWDECSVQIEGIRCSTSAQASKLLFRGQSDSTWRLSTTLERRGSGRNFSFIDYYRLVSRILPEIETESGLKWDVPTFQEISSWARAYDQTHYEMKAYEYLAHLRHNGFPSPLLDWTRSLYVAAYFAFSGAVTTDAVAIYVYLERPEGIKVGGEGVPAIRTLGQYVRTHRRHFRQQSAYTVCAKYQHDQLDGSNNWHFREPSDSIRYASIHTTRLSVEDCRPIKRARQNADALGRFQSKRLFAVRLRGEPYGDTGISRNRPPRCINARRECRLLSYSALT